MIVRGVDDTIEDYYKKVKDQYPNLTLEDFQKICKAPFDFFRKKIEGGAFPTILIKYLGKFTPFLTTKEKNEGKTFEQVVNKFHEGSV